MNELPTPAETPRPSEPASGGMTREEVFAALDANLCFARARATIEALYAENARLRETADAMYADSRNEHNRAEQAEAANVALRAERDALAKWKEAVHPVVAERVNALVAGEDIFRARLEAQGVAMLPLTWKDDEGGEGELWCPPWPYRIDPTGDRVVLSFPDESFEVYPNIEAAKAAADADACAWFASITTTAASVEAQPDAQELRRALCAIRIVDRAEGYELIRRDSMLDILDQRIAALTTKDTSP